MAPSFTETLTEPFSALKSKSEEPLSPAKAVAEQTPLEAISHGPVVMSGIPTFASHAEHRRHILVHTAAVFRYFSRCGFTEGMSGHISVRDPEHPHYIWMNPLGRHFGLMTAGDLICLDVRTGDIVGGNRTKPANAAGFLIHSEIHKARPDVHAVCHAHTDAGRAWSTFAKPLDMLNQDICNFHGALAVYADYGGIVFAQDEGKNIAKSLGSHNKGAILMNHGLITVGSTVDEAGFMFGLLDRGCRIQLQVEAAMAGNPSLKKHVVSDEEAAFNAKMASEKNSLYAEMQPDIDYEFEVWGEDVISRGIEKQRIDV